MKWTILDEGSFKVLIELILKIFLSITGLIRKSDDDSDDDSEGDE